MKFVKYRLSHFRQAANLIRRGQTIFCCNSLSKVGDGGGSGYRGGEGWISTPERKLFEETYNTRGYSFSEMYCNYFGEFISGEDLKETRLLALCFAHEIARLENEKNFKKKLDK
jgi:hypothetical protein